MRYKVGDKVVLLNNRKEEIINKNSLNGLYIGDSHLRFGDNEIDHEKTATYNYVGRTNQDREFDDVQRVFDDVNRGDFDHYHHELMKYGRREGDNLDQVNSPAHYQHGARETIEKIKLLLTHEEYIGFIKGNYIKYEDRMGYKDDKEVDKAKATYYVDLLEAETNEETQS